MSVQIQSFDVLSSDRIHTLKGVLVIPEGEIKGIFHLVHGMCEYIGRYDALFSALANEGYLCCGYDHLGHGKTACGPEELGFIAHRDGWKILVNDVEVFERAVTQQYPGKPVFLMGHSMGSFIVRLAAETLGDRIEKLIICGTGGPNPASPAGLLAADLVRLFKGEKHRSTLINQLAFGAYNKRFEGNTDYEWLTNDRAVINRYIADPFCHYLFTVSGMHDLVKLNARSNRAKWADSFRKDLPILLISGRDDPVGDYGKGVETVYRKLRAAGHTAVTLKLYDGCRHEIHNDRCREEMLRDLLQFIES